LGRLFAARPAQKFSLCLEKARILARNDEMARGLKTFLTALAVGIVTGNPGATDPFARDFALCAGRYSALVEHQWLVDGPASEGSAMMRDAFVDLARAVVGPEGAADVLNWRIEAKVAHGALLSRAWLARDSVAGKRSAQLLLACADLIGQS